jgi:hypothetical protein
VLTEKSQFFPPKTLLTEKRILRGLVASIIIFLTFFIFNPYIAVFFGATVVVINNEFRKFNILILILAFSFFFTNRSIGYWEGDDVIFYTKLYASLNNFSFWDLLKNFINLPTGNEILSFGLWWSIKNVFNFSEKVFIFLNYFLLIYLLSLIGNLIEKRYLMIFIFIYFFSFGDSTTHLLHIWRAQFALSVFLIGVYIYYNKNMRIGGVIAFASIGFHIALSLFLFLFIMYELLRKIRNKRIIFIVFISLGLIMGQLFINFYNTLLEGKFDPLLNDANKAVNKSPYYFLIIAIFSFYYNHKHKILSKAALFTSYCCLTFAAFFLLCSVNGLILYRYTSIGLPFMYVIIYEIAAKQKKTTIIILLCILFVYKIDFIKLNLLEFNQNFSDPFFGVGKIYYNLIK